MHLFSQYYHVLNARKLTDLAVKERDQIAITMLNEKMSPFDPAELLLFPSGQNNDTIVTILEAYWNQIITAEETVSKILEKVMETKKNELDEMFREVIIHEKRETIETGAGDREYELYAQQNCEIGGII
jgi:hypothetical protein